MQQTGHPKTCCFSAMGMTLLEIMLAVVLLVVGVVSIASLLSTGMGVDLEAEHRGEALYLAQEKMEEIRGASTYAAIDGFAATRANLGGAFADYDRQVTVAGSPKQVNVKVFWNAKNQEQNVELVSLFANYLY